MTDGALESLVCSHEWTTAQHIEAPPPLRRTWTSNQWRKKAEILPCESTKCLLSSPISAPACRPRCALNRRTKSSRSHTGWSPPLHRSRIAAFV